MVLVLAKLRIGPRTTSIPLSSDAFSCKTKRVKLYPLAMDPVDPHS